MSDDGAFASSRASLSRLHTLSAVISEAFAGLPMAFASVRSPFAVLCVRKTKHPGIFADFHDPASSIYLLKTKYDDAFAAFHDSACSVHLLKQNATTPLKPSQTPYAAFSSEVQVADPSLSSGSV